MATYLVLRHGSNGANQPGTQTMAVCFVELEADDEEAARKLVLKKITVYHNQHLEVLAEDEVDNDDWNNAVEDDLPTYTPAKGKLRPAQATEV